MKVFNLKLVILIWIMSFSNMINAAPKFYDATYIFIKNGISFAESKHKMIYDEEIKSWCIYTSSKTVGIFSLKKDIREESSCFSHNYNGNSDKQKVVSLSTIKYNFKRIKSKSVSVVKSNKVNNNLITLIGDKRIQHPKEIKIDRLTAQIFGFLLEDVKVSDKGRERLYSFSEIGRENIVTVLGNLDTVIIKKEIEGSKRSTITWYSYEKDFLPVKIEQYRLNRLMFTAKLETYRD